MRFGDVPGVEWIIGIAVNTLRVTIFSITLEWEFFLDWFLYGLKAQVQILIELIRLIREEYVLYIRREQTQSPYKTTNSRKKDKRKT